MKHRILELIMSVMLIVSVYVTVGIALPASANGDKTSKDKAGGESALNYEQVDYSDKIVVIDSGHGGIDGGKEASTGILEKDINLSIAYKLKQLLENSGIQVIMTRVDDNGLYVESDVNKKVADMKKRCEIIAESNANLVVSIHQNSFQSTGVSGAQVFYYTHSADGKKLAEIIQQSFKEVLNNENKRVAKADNTYYMLIHTKYPTVIAECGFLSNPQEAELLGSEEYQERVATALYNGIVEYLMLN